MVLGTGAVYSFDPVGSYEREACRAAGAASSLIQPFLDNQVSIKLRRVFFTKNCEVFTEESPNTDQVLFFSFAFVASQPTVNRTLAATLWFSSFNFDWGGGVDHAVRFISRIKLLLLVLLILNISLSLMFFHL